MNVDEPSKPTSEWTWSDSTNDQYISAPTNTSTKWPTTRKIAVVVFVSTLGVALVLTLLLVGIFDQPPQVTPLCPPGSVSDGKCISADSLSSATRTTNAAAVTAKTIQLPNTPQSISVSTYRNSSNRYKVQRLKYI